MTSGMLFALAIGTLIVFVLVGLMRRSRSAKREDQSAADTQTASQWTEGETTRLLSSAEVPGLYLLRVQDQHPDAQTVPLNDELYVHSDFGAAVADDKP